MLLKHIIHLKENQYKKIEKKSVRTMCIYIYWSIVICNKNVVYFDDLLKEGAFKIYYIHLEKMSFIRHFFPVFGRVITCKCY